MSIKVRQGETDSEATPAHLAPGKDVVLEFQTVHSVLVPETFEEVIGNVRCPSKYKADTCIHTNIPQINGLFEDSGTMFESALQFCDIL